MKIIQEYILLSNEGDFFKAIEIEGGTFFEVTQEGEYEEMSKYYFILCKNRMEERYK